MTWTRRQFVAGVSLVGLAAACKRATAAPKSPAPPPPDGERIRPGYQVMSRVDDTFDGDGLLRLSDGEVVRLDAKLVEKGRLPVKGVTSFALLPDRSLVVISTEGKTTAHRLVKDKVIGSFASTSSHVMPSAAPSMYWGIESSRIERVTASTGKVEKTHWLGDNMYPADACTQADGTLVFPSLFHMVHLDKGLTKYEWNDAPKHICRGPEPMTVWANVSYEKLLVLKLAGGKISVAKTFAMPAGDTLTHLTSNGSLAAGIVAHQIREGEASFSLVVWEVGKERFRVALDAAQHVPRVAVMSAKRVVALAPTPGNNATFDLATGKPA